MESKVYYISTDKNTPHKVVCEQLSRILEVPGLLEFIHAGDEIPIKVHFGEEGNTGYVDPALIEPISMAIHGRGARSILTDTNTLYKGQRTFTRQHLALAAKHGFTRSNTGTEVAIAEGETGRDITDVPIAGEYIHNAKIASLFCRLGSIISIAHFKGHLLTGFGGSLKNIGMGCASREGKLEQHTDLSPVIDTSNCTGCGECVKICPASAIALTKNRATINSHGCIGCAECIATCPVCAIAVDWIAGADTVQEKMVEYAMAVLKNKKESSLFINFAVKIRQECDCWPKDYPEIAPDLGILVSRDPVAVDKAAFDLVIEKCGRDVFRQTHPQIDCAKQLRHAAKIGLGSLTYTLIGVS